MEYLAPLVDFLSPPLNNVMLGISLLSILITFVALYLLPIISVINFFLTFFLDKRKILEGAIHILCNGVLIYLFCLILNQSTSISPVSRFFFTLFRDQHIAFVILLLGMGLNLITLFIVYIFLKPDFRIVKQSFLNLAKSYQTHFVFALITILFNQYGPAL